MARPGRKRKDRLGKSSDRDVGMTPEAAQRRLSTIHGNRYMVLRDPNGWFVADLEKRQALPRGKMTGEATAWDGTVLHCLFLRAEIDRGMLDAGRKFASITQHMRMLMDCPQAGIRQPGKRNPPSEMTPEEQEEARAEFIRARREYDSALAALSGYAERMSVKAVVMDQTPDSMDALISGLGALAGHFGYALDKQQKTGQCRSN